MTQPPFASNETIEREIPPSKNTVAYYTIKAAPLFGVWFVGLIVFLIYSFKLKGGSPQTLLFQALALSVFAYLIGVIARWLWRVDVSQRDAWITNLGIWVQNPSGMKFVPYAHISSLRKKNDWMQKWLHLNEIEIQFVTEGRSNKIALVGVENADEIMVQIQGHLPPSSGTQV